MMFLHGTNGEDRQFGTFYCFGVAVRGYGNLHLSRDGTHPDQVAALGSVEPRRAIFILRRPEYVARYPAPQPCRRQGAPRWRGSVWRTSGQE